MASSSKQAKKEEEKKVGGDHFRRTWDADEFEKKAKERLQEDLDFLDGKASSSSSDPPVQREKLKARDYAVDLQSRLGKSQVITKTTALADQGGYYCNVCDCVVKDSINFLDHINGKKHQRNMGMSMKVERSSLDQVKARFAMNKKKKEDDEKKKDYDFDSRIKELEDEDDRVRQRRRDSKSERKRKQQEALQEYQDDDVAAMMGFGGFGGSK